MKKMLNEESKIFLLPLCFLRKALLTHLWKFNNKRQQPIKFSLKQKQPGLPPMY